MSNIALSQREEYLKKKRKKRLVKLWLVLSLIIAVLILVIVFFRLQRFRISTVTLSGGVLVKEEDISSTTKDFINGNYFWLFPRNSYFLYPHDKLEILLKERFQRIDTISVNSENFQTINVKVTERNLNALWCDAPPEIVSSEKCYFMDNFGTIFAEAPNFSGDAYFKYYGLIATTSAPIGSQYIASTSKFREIGEFIVRAQKLSLHPVYLLATDLEGQFTMGLAGGGVIYIDTKEPISKIADNLEALLRSISTTTMYSAQNIDYIDLRFGNKLFYKLK